MTLANPDYKEAIETIRELFLNRTDTYAKQNSNGTYTRVEEEITDKKITFHFGGEETIASYQLAINKKVKWICFDFDGEDLDQQKRYAQSLYNKLKMIDELKSILLEFSGKKGFHVWVFCEQIDTASAKIWGSEIGEGFKYHELFPKQDDAKDKPFGNCVKLPLGVHQVSGKKSTIYDENFKELNFEDSLKYLKKLAQLPKVQIPKVIVKEIIRTIIKPHGKKEMPGYIKALINSGSIEGDRHKNEFIITKELYNAGFSNDEILSHARDFNNNCKPPKDEYVIESHVKYLLQYPEKYLTKEDVKEIPAEDLARITDVDYKKVIEVYRKWIYMKDFSGIDVALATAITRKAEQVPLWIIMIAPSGAGKSELIKPLEDKRNPSTTEIMSKITPNTFLSGVSKKREDYVDFAQTLKNNPKLFLTYDFAQFVKLDSKDKAQVWAQMRDIYDGFIERKAGLGVSKKVTGLRINWIICTTPVIDTELLVQQELGTRELIYRFEHEEINEQELMDRVWDNSQKVKDMRKELAFFVRAFIEKIESEGLRDIKITETSKKELMLIAQTIAVLRAATESDNFTGELTNFVYKEMPTRILLQLKGLFTGLMNLSKDYKESKALEIITRIALSSMHPIRLRIVIELLTQGKVSTTGIQKGLSIGYKTVVTQLYTALQLGLVKYDEDETTDDDYEGVHKVRKKKMWSVTDHEVIKYLAQVHNLKEKWEGLFEKTYEPHEFKN